MLRICNIWTLSCVTAGVPGQCDARFESFRPISEGPNTKTDGQAANCNMTCVCCITLPLLVVVKWHGHPPPRPLFFFNLGGNGPPAWVSEHAPYLAFGRRNTMSLKPICRYCFHPLCACSFGLVPVLCECIYRAASHRLNIAIQMCGESVWVGFNRDCCWGTYAWGCFLFPS